MQIQIFIYTKDGKVPYTLYINGQRRTTPVARSLFAPVSIDKINLLSQGLIYKKNGEHCPPFFIIDYPIDSFCF